MSVLPPKKGTHRRPSLKGAVMQDVVRGVERTRIWPRPKGSNQTPAQLQQQEWFRQCNWAFKYMDARIQAVCRKATHRTSLYPRDFFTMLQTGMVMTLLDDDNKRYWPLAYVLDVSESLDAITASVGEILIREADRWRGIPLPVAPPVPSWTVLLDQTIASATPNLDVDVSAYDQIMVELIDVTVSASGQRQMLVSTDGGSTFHNAATDYRFINADGTSALAAQVNLHNTASAAARSAFAQIYGAKDTTGPKPGSRLNVENSPQWQFQANTLAITDIRIRNSAGNMTGGRVRVLAL